MKIFCVFDSFAYEETLKPAKAVRMSDTHTVCRLQRFKGYFTEKQNVCFHLLMIHLYDFIYCGIQ